MCPTMDVVLEEPTSGTIPEPQTEIPVELIDLLVRSEFETPALSVEYFVQLDSGSKATENVIGADATAPTPSLPASSSNRDPSAIIPVQNKRQLEMRPTETPVTEPPTTKLKPQPASAMEAQFRFGHPTINQAGCPIRLEPERVADGWYVAELTSEALRI